MVLLEIAGYVIEELKHTKESFDGKRKCTGDR